MMMADIFPWHLADWVLNARDPEALALRCDDKAYNYRQLANGVRKLAEVLPPLTVENPVCALVMKKSIPAVQAVLAVLSRGGCYAPLDASYPPERLQAVLAVLKPAVLVTDENNVATLRPPAAALGIPLININGLAEHQKNSHQPINQPLAAILHTSGSTGLPKSVRIGAAQIEAFSRWVRDTFAPGRDDRLINHSPLAFDLTFLDLFSIFRCGATLLLTREEDAANGPRIGQICRQQRATLWHSTPTSLRLLLGADDKAVYPDMRAVLFAGEPMPGAQLERLRKLFPSAAFYNIYGSSETNDTFCYPCPQNLESETVPLGYPLAYTDWRLLDEQLEAVVPEEGGELWVHCPTLMEGYGDPALTEQAFRHFEGKRFFRTRDRVRKDAEGVFHFLGRCDDIVKLNGYRVDLQDVEQNALRCGWLEECVAFVAERNGERQLELAAQGLGEHSALALRQHLMQQLPAYALPRRYHLQSQPLPKNANGKLSRQAVIKRFGAQEDNQGRHPVWPEKQGEKQ